MITLNQWTGDSALTTLGTITSGDVSAVVGVGNASITTLGTVTSGNVAAVVGIGNTSITTLGTITTGVWNGTIPTVTYGGTGADLHTTQGVVIQTTAGAVFSNVASTTTATDFLGGDLAFHSINAGQITALGTIATGVWNGTIPTVTYGGTGTNLSGSQGVLVQATTGAAVTDVPWTNVTTDFFAGDLTFRSLNAGQITNVGTILTGAWQGTAVGVTYGGTGANLVASQGVLVQATTGAAVTDVASTTIADFFGGDLAFHTLNTTNVAYTPAVPGNWASTPPSTTQQAIDRIAAWINANNTVFTALGITTQP